MGRKLVGPKFYVPCSRCLGDGFTEVTGAYLETLKAMAALSSEITGAELGRRMGVPATAMNNRLAWLAKHKFLTARKWGRKTLYQAV